MALAVGSASAQVAFETPAAQWNETLPNDSFVSLGAIDASLNDLAIVTEDRVIAVGDRGVILASDNSGRNWHIVVSDTTANLRAVAFDPRGLGLAVGGWIGNYTRASHAVVLRSADGGRHWSPIRCDSLPRLTGICMLGNRIVAWGDYSALWKSSLFESSDGGLTWRVAMAPIGHASAAGSTAAGEVGIVDVLGRASFSSSGLYTTLIGQPNKPLHCLHHTGQNWLACGASGELIASADGKQWRDVPLPLAPDSRAVCSWNSIEQVGNEIWIGGMPGSILLYSPDCGATWNIRKTGQTLPISSIRFLDRNRGWATGPMGLILATRDGGKSWYAQRQMSRRLALLTIASAPEDCPWSPLVAAAWDESVAVASLVCAADDPIEQAGFLASTSTCHEDVAPKLGLAGYKACMTPSGPGEAAKYFAAELLCWRPDVVLTSGSHVSPVRGRSQLSEDVFAALQICANGNGPIAKELDLPAWNVSKLITVTDPASSQFTEQSARFLRNPGLSIWDLLLPLPPADREQAAQIAMRTTWAQSQAKAVSASVMGGIPPSEETLRHAKPQSIGNYQLVMGRVHREKSAEQLARRSGDSDSIGQWTQDLDFVLQTFPHRETPHVLFQLASRLQSPLHWQRRQIVLNRLITAHPHHDAADWARVELLVLEHSDERLAWQKSWEAQMKSSPFAIESSMPASVPAERLPHEIGATEPWNATPFGETTTPRNPTATSSLVVPASAEILLFRRIESVQSTDSKWMPAIRNSPILSARPDMELLSYRITKCLTESRERVAHSGDHLQSVMSAVQLVGWPQMARQELLLSTNRVDQLRWTCFAAATDKLPILDGQLDEEFWNAMPAMRLESLDESDTHPSTEAQSTILWAHDEHYLYIGIECPRNEDTDPRPLVEQRGYDADVTELDHVQFLLDTDRDYCTAIELAVSADGRTYDRCCGCSEFNPKWYVFVKPDRYKWTAEIAIELDSLTTQTPLGGKAWAVSVRRNNPAGQSQSWSQLRTHEPLLHASGLLLFVP